MKPTLLHLNNRHEPIQQSFVCSYLPPGKFGTISCSEASMFCNPLYWRGWKKSHWRSVHTCVQNRSRIYTIACKYWHWTGVTGIWAMPRECIHPQDRRWMHVKFLNQIRQQNVWHGNVITPSITSSIHPRDRRWMHVKFFNQIQRMYGMEKSLCQA